MPVRILIDHGSTQNIGDNAMLLNNLHFLSKYEHVECYLMGRRNPFWIKKTKLPVKEVAPLKGLFKMPHWRIREYKVQPLVLRQICAVLFWSILTLRALRIYYQIRKNRQTQKQEESLNNQSSLIEIMPHMDAFWVVGGGNINDIWIEHTFWKMAIACMFKWQKKKVVFSGQGIGPVEKLSTRIITKMILKNITIMSVREKYSYDLLINLNPGILNKVKLVGDDALFNFTFSSDVITNLPPKYIVFNMRFSEYSSKDITLLTRCAHLLDTLGECYPDYHFILVPFALNKEDSDIITAQKILREIKEIQNRIIIVRENISLESIKSVLRKADFAIGVSYHFCLFSLSFGIPTTGLYTNEYYRQKLEGLMNMFDRKNGVFDLREGEVSSLTQNIIQSLKDFEKEPVAMATKCMEKNWEHFAEKTIMNIARE